MIILKLSLYSEDKSDSAKSLKALKELVKGMLKVVEPAVKTNHIEINPVDNTKKINGSYWKVTTKAIAGAQETRRLLIQSIVTEILQNKFVIFHVDGDSEWKNKDCTDFYGQLKQFKEALEYLIKTGGGAQKLSDYFIALVPFYSIETWAYSNTAELLKYVDQSEKELVGSWQVNLQSIDEVCKIKEAISVKDGKNYELFLNRSTFPFDDLVAIDKSYACALKDLKGSSLLIEKLKETTLCTY